MELNQYLEVFIEESKEHLQACNEQLLELEKNPQDLSIINEIFRSAHTLKGCQRQWVTRIWQALLIKWKMYWMQYGITD